jgi:predicted nucleic acid-binding protein
MESSSKRGLEQPVNFSRANGSKITLVELAVAGGADYIVTKNLRDVARMELLFPNLKVVFPETLVKEIKL